MEGVKEKRGGERERSRELVTISTTRKYNIKIIIKVNQDATSLKINHILFTINNLKVGIKLTI